MTTPTRRQHGARTPTEGSPVIATRQVTWTRLGGGMGHTNTEAKRAELSGAVAAMAWRDPAELAEVLNMAPARQVIALLLGGRRWALRRAAIATLPAIDPCRGERRLLALESVSGKRYLLMDDCGYEWLHLYTDRPMCERVETRR
jgi:hypothetical protein